jgi:predicted secreted protein
MLSTYVVVSSHRKMLNRLMHTKYSQPYMKGLLRIVNTLSTANYQYLEPLALTSRDMTFLMSIQQIVPKSSHDASRCKEIDCKFNCGYKLHLPELCRIAEMAKSSTEPPIFYTEATFLEYHRLLVNLLEHFKLHLCALVKDAQRGNDCHHHINMIRLFGSTLNNMVSSQIMGRHMQNIEESLWQAMNKQKQEEAKGSVGVNLNKAKDNSQWPRKLSGERISLETGIETAMGSGVVEVEADNFDEALACVQWGAVAVDSTPSHMTAELRPLWKLCRDWLRLTVTNFTAMEQLLPTNPGRQSLPIPSSVTVLTAHYQGQHMLPWKDVLRDYLPVSDKFPSSSAEKIIEQITALQELAESQPSPLANWFSHHFGPGSKLFRDEFAGPLHGEALIASLIDRAHNEGNITVEDEPFLVCFSYHFLVICKLPIPFYVATWDQAGNILQMLPCMLPPS